MASRRLAADLRDPSVVAALAAAWSAIGDPKRTPADPIERFAMESIATRQVVVATTRSGAIGNVRVHFVP
jgi:hypothetical protein